MVYRPSSLQNNMKTSNLFLGITLGAAAGFAAYKSMNPTRKVVFDAPLIGAHKTALITGASSGIGESFARKLAALGYDLILVARREDKLTALAHELEHRHMTRVNVFTADLSLADGISGVAKLIEETDNLELLINNAGFGTVGNFVDVPVQGQIDQVMLHDVASLQLARAALPGMLKANKGGIINVASVAAFAGLPGNVTYSASKRFLVVFSEALQAELDGTNVFAQALCPGFTRTEFHYKGDWLDGSFKPEDTPEILWMTADGVADESLRSLGTGNPVCITGAPNKLMVAGITHMPRNSLARTARRAVKGMLKR